MSINKFNSEGYYDPTTYEALTNIEKEERALRAFRPIRLHLLTLCRECDRQRGERSEIQPLRCGRRIYPHCAPSADFRSSSMTPIQRSVSWGCFLETPS